MCTAISLQTESFRPSGLLPIAGFSRHRGWLTDRPGGLGDAVNQVERSAGGTTCLACWFLHLAFIFYSFLLHIVFSLRSFFRSFLHQIPLSSVSPRYLLVATLFITFLSPACVSPRYSDSQMLRILKAEARLLESLKQERRHPPLLKALHNDETTSEAEMHLRDAIDALIRANGEMQTTLRNR